MTVLGIVCLSLSVIALFLHHVIAGLLLLGLAIVALAFARRGVRL